MFTYFTGCQSVADVKQLYRSLCFKYHPDQNPDVDDRFIKEINVEYKKILQSFHGNVTTDDGNSYTYKYNSDLEQELIDVIDQLLKSQFDGVDFYLVGTWIWVTGNTKPYKEILKNLKFLWNGNRSMWFYRSNSSKSYRSSKSFDEIARCYGVEKLENKKTKVLK